MICALNVHIFAKCIIEQIQLAAAHLLARSGRCAHWAVVLDQQQGVAVGPHLGHITLGTSLLGQ